MGHRPFLRLIRHTRHKCQLPQLQQVLVPPCFSQHLHLSAYQTAHLLYDRALPLAYIRPIHSISSIAPHLRPLLESFESLTQMDRSLRQTNIPQLQHSCLLRLTHFLPLIEQRKSFFNWESSTMKPIDSKNQRFVLRGAQKKMEGVVSGC